MITDHLFNVPDVTLKYLYSCNTPPEPNSTLIPSEPWICTLGFTDMKETAEFWKAYIWSLKLFKQVIGPYLPSKVNTSFCKISVQLSINSEDDFNFDAIIFVSKLFKSFIL